MLVRAVLLGAMMFGLCACGGGSGGSSTVDPPLSQTQSVSALGQQPPPKSETPKPEVEIPVQPVADDPGVSQAQLETSAWLYQTMQREYFWAEHVPALDYAQFADSQALLNALLYRMRDRWSYLSSVAQETQRQQGKSRAYGVNFYYTAKKRLVLQYVHRQSDAGKNGLRRGDEIRRIDEKKIQDFKGSQDIFDTLAAFADDRPLLLHVYRPSSGESFDVSLIRTEFLVDTVNYASIFTSQRTQREIGYLVFNRFLYETSQRELRNAFGFLKTGDLSRMIVDLRGNRGGSIATTKVLASLLVPPEANAVGKTFLRYVFNQIPNNPLRAEAGDARIKFTRESHQIDVEQIIVLTDRYSCSASEALVNGLKPYVSVVTVGGSTCGKPVGMYRREKDDTVLWAINFEMQNARGEGAYYDGIPPDCFARFDQEGEYPFGDFGDHKRDAMLSAALNIADGGTCQSQTAATRRLPEGPDTHENHQFQLPWYALPEL